MPPKKCDRFRRGLKRLRTKGARLLMSPTLLRFVFTTAPMIFRFVRWVHRNFGDGS
jgi:hypothetical protein